MAGTNGPNSPITHDFSPAEKIAQRLSHRLALRPPVSAQQVAVQFANIEETQLPVDADAITIGLKQKGMRPRIILNQDRGWRRKRFTLAHEIGHIIIPWHTGTIISHTDFYATFHDEIYRQIEREANRFASELLLPRDWLAERIQSSKSLSHVLLETEKADVSIIVAAIRLSQVLPSGYVFVEFSPGGTVLNSGRSVGTGATAPFRGRQFDPFRAFPLASQKGEVKSGKNVLYWWQFEDRPSFSVPNDHQSGREILEEILLSLRVTGKDAETMKHKINGVIGSANSMTSGEPIEMLARRLEQRFSSRPDLYPIVSHPNFQRFLAKRCEELVDRRRALFRR